MGDYMKIKYMTSIELYKLTKAINNEWINREHYNPKNKRWIE